MIYPKKIHDGAAYFIKGANEKINSNASVKELTDFTDRFVAYTMIEVEKDKCRSMYSKNPAFKTLVEKFGLTISFD